VAPDLGRWGASLRATTLSRSSSRVLWRYCSRYPFTRSAVMLTPTIPSLAAYSASWAELIWAIKSRDSMEADCAMCACVSACVSEQGNEQQQERNTRRSGISFLYRCLAAATSSFSSSSLARPGRQCLHNDGMLPQPRKHIAEQQGKCIGNELWTFDFLYPNCWRDANIAPCHIKVPTPAQRARVLAPPAFLLALNAESKRTHAHTRSLRLFLAYDTEL